MLKHKFLSIKASSSYSSNLKNNKILNSYATLENLLRKHSRTVLRNRCAAANYRCREAFSATTR